MFSKLKGAGRRILVIDDDLAIRVLLQAVLARMSFDVELAADGAAGLERIQSGAHFDLILLDLMMPRLNGYEFISAIDRLHGFRRHHIVVFTASGQQGIDAIPASSVCNAILKPFDLDRFIEIITECLDDSHIEGPFTASSSPTPTPPA